MSTHSMWINADENTPEVFSVEETYYRQSDRMVGFCSDGVLRIVRYRVYDTGILPDWRTDDQDSWFVEVKWWLKIPKLP